MTGLRGSSLRAMAMRLSSIWGIGGGQSRKMTDGDASGAARQSGEADQANQAESDALICRTVRSGLLARRSARRAGRCSVTGTHEYSRPLALADT